jgi:hypothetical protein
MNITNLVLLPATIYGIPSGNYNGQSTTFVGNAVPAANYYMGQGTVQTVPVVQVDLRATVTLQATLNDQPEQAAWFDVSTVGNVANAQTATSTITAVGNFVWLRARVDNFTAGTVSARAIY